MRTQAIWSARTIMTVLILTPFALFAQQSKGSVVTPMVERKDINERSMRWVEMDSDVTKRAFYQVRTDDLGNTVVDYVLTTLGGDNPQASLSNNHTSGAFGVCGLQPNSAIQAVPAGNDSLSLFINSEATRIDSIKIVYHNVCGLTRLEVKFGAVPGVLIDPATCTALFNFSCFRNALDGHRFTINFNTLTVTDTLISRSNCSTVCATRQFTLPPLTSVNESEDNIPSQATLDQNFPNPFNPTTTIRFSLRRSEYVTLRIFNMLGKQTATLVSENMPAGTHQVEWDAQSMASGVYFYQLQAGSFSQTRKLLLLK